MMAHRTKTTSSRDRFSDDRGAESLDAGWPMLRNTLFGRDIRENSLQIAAECRSSSISLATSPGSLCLRVSTAKLGRSTFQAQSECCRREAGGHFSPIYTHTPHIFVH